MSDLQILQELGLPIFMLRTAPFEQSVQTATLPCIVFVSETIDAFSKAHQAQLDKILAFLNFTEQDYVLVYSDQVQNQVCNYLLSFGNAPEILATHSIATHSISAMLQTPDCKREVLHAIRHLKA